jgi:hypothetical protein
LTIAETGGTPQRNRSGPVTSSTADIGAYFVLSQGSTPQAMPITHGFRAVSATITASAAAISG